MKIYFISTSRYPTEKAYGVTVGNTCLASTRLGHDGLILSASGSTKDEFENRVTQIQNVLNPILMWVAKREFFSRISRLAFNLNSIALGISLHKQLKQESEAVLWLRDILTTYVLELMGNRNPKVLEVHHIPGKLNSLLLSVLIKQKGFVLCTITNRHREKLLKKFPNCKILVVPMAVPAKFLSESKSPSFRSRLRIGYVGKFKSSGNDNDLSKFIDSLEMLKATDLHISLDLVGIEDDQLKFLRSYVNKRQFEHVTVRVGGHISHASIKQFLDVLDIGVIPYIQSTYNDNRFPIKTLEYASTKCLILASDIEAHRAILNETRAVFYDPLEKQSLQEALIWISKNPEACALRVEEAYKWAKNYSYERRVLDVLDNLQ